MKEKRVMLAIKPNEVKLTKSGGVEITNPSLAKELMAIIKDKSKFNRLKLNIGCTCDRNCRPR